MHRTVNKEKITKVTSIYLFVKGFKSETTIVVCTNTSNVGKITK